MDTPRYISVLRLSGEDLASFAEGDLGRPVPSCPEWDMADLVWHTAEVHYFWRSIVSGAITGPDEYTEPERPDEGELLAWYRDGLAETARVLADADPSAGCWTWASRKDVGFVQRRMAQETAVHSWDAAMAVGHDRPLPSDVAVDGVSEFLEHMLSAGTHPEEPVGNVALRSTDTRDVWSASFDEKGWRIARTVEPAAATASAPASDLLLALWRRKGTNALEVTGDTDALARFLDVAETE